MLLAALLAGCAGVDPMTALDTSNTTQEQAMSLTLEEQFELYGQRYDHMQELIRDAQVQISDGTWYWNGVGILPRSGEVSSVLPGVTAENSYYLTDGRIYEVPGLTGDRKDLEPMRKYFESKGWAHGDVTFYDEYSVQAETGDGWVIKYVVQQTGQYYVQVTSGVFWGRGNDLLHAIAGRTTKDLDQQQSVPGQYAPFPKWTDPIVNPPEF